MPLVIRLDSELEKGLDELSEEENTPKAEILRNLLRERLARRRKPPNAFAVAQELGVIGVDNDPRTDVARQHSRYLRAALRGKRHP
jgi:metal-responsive CopG/Arc/MetJ family transcriptional regulator